MQGAGDRLAARLESVGITEERTLAAVNAARAVVGLPPKKDCGCSKRKALLNKAFPGITVPPWFSSEASRAAQMAPVAKPSPWDGLVLPQAADGWELVDHCEKAVLFKRAGASMVFGVLPNQEYTSAHHYASAPDRAKLDYESRCR